MKRYFLFLVILLNVATAFAQTKVVAHRGARHEGAPYENTLEALKFAQELGVDVVEFDINLTSDGKVIVVHGPSFPGETRKVQEMTFKELRAAELPGGTRMPTLREWFRQAKKTPEITMVLEIKPHPTKEQETKAVEKAMKLARRMRMGDQLQYTTFSEWVASEIKRIDPNAKVLFLSNSRSKAPDAAWAKEHGYEMSYAEKVWRAHPEYLKQAKELGVETTIWIVNEESTIDWVLEQGFDYVSTDYPERIYPYVRSKTGGKGIR